MEFSYVPPGEVIGLPCTLNRFCLSMMCQCAVTNNGGYDRNIGLGTGRDNRSQNVFLERDGIDIFQN